MTLTTMWEEGNTSWNLSYIQLKLAAQPLWKQPVAAKAHKSTQYMHKENMQRAYLT